MLVDSQLQSSCNIGISPTHVQQQVPFAPDCEYKQLPFPDLPTCIVDVDIGGAEGVKVADEHILQTVSNNNRLEQGG